MTRWEPRREDPLGDWREAASIPPCIWPSPPQEAQPTAGLGGTVRGGEVREKRLSREDGSGSGRGHMGLGTGGIYAEHRGRGGIVAEL